MKLRPVGKIEGRIKKLSNQDKYHFNAIFLKIKINAKHLQCIKYERI